MYFGTGGGERRLIISENVIVHKPALQRPDAIALTTLPNVVQKAQLCSSGSFPDHLAQAVTLSMVSTKQDASLGYGAIRLSKRHTVCMRTCWRVCSSGVGLFMWAWRLWVEEQMYFIFKHTGALSDICWAVLWSGNTYATATHHVWPALSHFGGVRKGSIPLCGKKYFQ